MLVDCSGSGDAETRRIGSVKGCQRGIMQGAAAEHQAPSYHMPCILSTAKFHIQHRWTA